MRYAREQLADVLPEMKPLLVEHWEEIAHFKDVPLDPDYDAYLKAEAAGKLRLVTARVDGRLVGYAVFFIGNLHYRSTPIATQDVLFLLPAYRKGGAGYGLIKFSDESLGTERIRVVYHHVKCAPALDFSPLLERLGYQCVDKVYARRL